MRFTVRKDAAASRFAADVSRAAMSARRGRGSFTGRFDVEGRGGIRPRLDGVSRAAARAIRRDRPPGAGAWQEAEAGFQPSRAGLLTGIRLWP
ncbi:hypothetical protein [Dokdonella sp.]|uniref:hypothetical protein n=1 Tax=Dokdonella sp. TaxID=2291710 RepID=UPI0026396391|nr:hypothetical protein [Dokdonella sp.]